MIEGVFWLCVIILGYTYFGYPALIRIWAWCRPRTPGTRGWVPTLSVVIVAYNEAKVIRRRLENLLTLDYPRDRLEIVLASDGSTDATVEVARRYEPLGVRVIPFATRCGKSAVLNDVVPGVQGEIVILADARQHFDTSALRKLVEPFADPTVGTVSGELFLTDNPGGTAVGKGVGFYWRYEKFIRRSEGRVDSTVGATGAIYAIRRELFEPVPEDTILDDVLIPIRVARRGYRVLFEPAARAYDGAAATATQEFKRKVRTIAGNFQLFSRERWLLNPLRNRLWLQTVSHKGLRLLSPFFLTAAFGGNLFLLDQPFYRWTLAAQIVFYTVALLGYTARNARRSIPLLSVPYVFCFLNWVTVVAFVRFVTGRQRVSWEMASA